MAWRRFAAAGAAAGFEPETLYLLAESIFAYIDVLSAESADGHAVAQSAAAGEAELRRRRLVRLLVREPPVDEATAQAAAGDAEWPLPRTLAAITIGGERQSAAVARLPADAIAERFPELTCVLLGDPDGPGRRAAVERAIAESGASAGLGPSVEWSEAALSYNRARGALELCQADGELAVARERAGELLLRAQPELAEDLAAHRLAPLADLPAGSRERLRETLRVWLAEQGRLGRVAERLGIHPQTARYRIARLRELFGAELEDPDARFWLELALRVS